MADPMSEADKIRMKRLAKLSAPSQTSSSTSGEAQARSEATPSANPSHSNVGAHSSEQTPRTPTPQPKAERDEGSQRPQAESGQSRENGVSKINIIPATSTNSLKRGRPSTAPEQSLETWADKTLGAVFRVTVDEQKLQDSHGHRLIFLPGAKADLEAEGAPILLSTDVLDQVLLESGTMVATKSTEPLDYLLGCWKRVTRQYKSLKSKPEDPKFSIIREARRLCMSYCIFAITMQEMFGCEPATQSPLLPHLLVDQEDDIGICHDFLTELVARIPEDENIEIALQSALGQLCNELAHKTMLDDYKRYVLALRNIVRYPALVHTFVRVPLFLPQDGLTAANIEAVTCLGPLFQISPCQAAVTSNYFSSPKSRDRGYIQNSQNALRMTLQTHQADLLDIVNHIIKAGKEPREKMLDWFAACVNLNHKRRAMQVDKKTVSSDGFMLNVTVCLDQLCEPFMDATFSKIDRIDADYLRRKPRIDIKEETKLNADQNTSDQFYSQQAEGQSNFISELFFLTLAAHHYGSEAVNATLSQLEKQLNRMEKAIQEMEAERPKFANNPAQLRLWERTHKKYTDELDKGLSYKLTIQGVLLDELTQQRSMQFMRYVIVWLLRLVAPAHDYPKAPLKLPLPTVEPEVFKCLPEYFLEDVVGNFKFIMRNMPHIITSTQSDELATLCITFLRSSEYIKNPYLKSGLVTIMFHGIWPTYGRNKGVLGDLLNGLTFATEHLLHALMKFYIEVENTGAHTQFYDKFNIRYEIFQIIKCVWSNTIYRENLAEEAKVNLDFFVRFVNLLLNDVTYVLDESLTSLHKIHSVQETLADSGLDQAERTAKEEELAEAQNKAKSYMQLTNETVAMLKLFTAALAESFTMPEIVQRLADMLDYNLDVMVGKKSKELKVQNATEYGFNPRALLAEIVDVYLNLRNKQNFVVAVARDGRSYKPENFDTATTILRKYALKSPEELLAWNEVGEKFKKAKELDDQAEEDLGEIPDDFLDPLMATLMEDPVILPISKQVVDRSTIRSHLLSDPNDPFNRTPLKIEDVIPDVALREKIMAFKVEKRGQKMADVMDTTSG